MNGDFETLSKQLFRKTTVAATRKITARGYLQRILSLCLSLMFTLNPVDLVTLTGEGGGGG